MVVLISDGEDNENSISQAVDIAKENNIHIVTIGVGTEKGAPIPMYYNGFENGYKLDQSGNTVISKLEDNNLKKLAQETNGTYIQLHSISKAVSQLAFYKTNPYFTNAI